MVLKWFSVFLRFLALFMMSSLWPSFAGVISRSQGLCPISFLRLIICLVWIVPPYRAPKMSCRDHTAAVTLSCCPLLIDKSWYSVRWLACLQAVSVFLSVFLWNSSVLVLLWLVTSVPNFALCSEILFPIFKYLYTHLSSVYSYIHGLNLTCIHVPF